MPGINYQQVRELAPMQRVLELLDFQPTERHGAQWRGPCPVHQSKTPTSRSFSVNVETHAFQCFTCGAAGNQLDLWAAAQQLPLFEAARDLCERLGIEVPAVERW